MDWTLVGVVFGAVVVGILAWAWISSKNDDDRPCKEATGLAPDEEPNWHTVKFPTKRTETNLVILPECGDVNLKRVNVEKDTWAQFILDAREGKADIRLAREPENPFDPNAIAAHAVDTANETSQPLGYLPKEIAAYMAATYTNELPIDVELVRAGIMEQTDAMFIAVNVLGPRAKVRKTFLREDAEA